MKVFSVEGGVGPCESVSKGHGGGAEPGVDGRGYSTVRRVAITNLFTGGTHKAEEGVCVRKIWPRGRPHHKKQGLLTRNLLVAIAIQLQAREVRSMTKRRKRSRKQ